jgi:hypothetical protein
VTVQRLYEEDYVAILDKLINAAAVRTVDPDLGDSASNC